MNKDTYIAITVTNNSQMKKINKKYKGKNSTTDVLSFEIKEKQDDGTFYLGDIVVNRDQAKKQAKKNLETEIANLVAHGVKHLYGIHHKDDK